MRIHGEKLAGATFVWGFCRSERQQRARSHLPLLKKFWLSRPLGGVVSWWWLSLMELRQGLFLPEAGIATINAFPTFGAIPDIGRLAAVWDS
ncbi:hypothetical protein OIU76_003662 [Salix suchowensis]|nr:hypothetical protein OIU76_003662 [Salix suchowensis]